jgi:hypothetical protein
MSDRTSKRRQIGGSTSSRSTPMRRTAGSLRRGFRSDGCCSDFAGMRPNAQAAGSRVGSQMPLTAARSPPLTRMHRAAKRAARSVLEHRWARNPLIQEASPNEHHNHLASGQITAVDTITIELVEADETPAIVIIGWPDKPPSCIRAVLLLVRMLLFVPSPPPSSRWLRAGEIGGFDSLGDHADRPRRPGLAPRPGRPGPPEATQLAVKQSTGTARTVRQLRDRVRSERWAWPPAL